MIVIMIIIIMQNIQYPTTSRVDSSKSIFVNPRTITPLLFWQLHDTIFVSKKNGDYYQQYTVQNLDKCCGIV